MVETDKRDRGAEEKEEKEEIGTAEGVEPVRCCKTRTEAVAQLFISILLSNLRRKTPFLFRMSSNR